MSLADAFKPIDQINRAIVMGNTWGHLAPEPRRKYKGSIIWTHGAYGDIVPIKVSFDGLPDSPWFYDQMNDFISEGYETERGNIYKFVGTYMQYKNGRCHFSGKCHAMTI